MVLAAVRATLAQCGCRAVGHGRLTTVVPVVTLAILLIRVAGSVVIAVWMAQCLVTVEHAGGERAG
ncbi:hypothetical protein DI005_21330 [Prauserella sp. PE36]|nr:hypothetical protein DI005_21330 [Prauserella sp. PE36]